MPPTDIESGKDDGDLLIGHAHGVSRDDEDVIELDEDDLMVDDEERAADAGDLDYEPDDSRDY